MSTTIPPTTPTPPPTPQIVNKKVPPAVLWGVVAIIVFPLVVLGFKLLLPSETPSPQQAPSSSGGWLVWLAWITLTVGAGYTVYRYFQKSDGKLAAAVGGWLVIGGAILAVLYLILGDNLSTKLIVTGLEGTRSMLDPAARDGGGTTSVATPTILKMTGGDGNSKRFEVPATPVEVVVPNGTRTVTLCLRPAGADLAAVTRNPAPTFSHEAISGGRRYTPAPHVAEIYRGKKMPVEIRLNGAC